MKNTPASINSEIFGAPLPPSMKNLTTPWYRFTNALPVFQPFKVPFHGDGQCALNLGTTVHVYQEKGPIRRVSSHNKQDLLRVQYVFVSFWKILSLRIQKSVTLPLRTQPESLMVLFCVFHTLKMWSMSDAQNSLTADQAEFPSISSLKQE